MSKADQKIADAVTREHARQVERLCRRKYGNRAWTKPEILEVVREMLGKRIQRMTASISYLGDQAGVAARQVEALGRVLQSVKPEKAKPRPGDRKRRK